MTVNKTYQILKAEGFIKTDRRLGAFVAENINMDIEFRESLNQSLSCYPQKQALQEWIRQNS